MKNRLFQLISITLIFASCKKDDSNSNSPVQTKRFGHEQGNATDNPPLGFGGAWMLGDENTINYCFVVSDDFGATKETVKNEIQAAMNLWKNYITTKKINEALENSYINNAKYRPNPPSQEELLERAKKFHLSTQSNFHSQCDGSENLKFYLGSEDRSVQEIRENYYNPTAFAHRTQYDGMTGIGKGFIWLAKQEALGPERGNYPDWSQKNRLRGVLIHEIGHFYGVGHVEETIMQESLFGLLLKPEWTSVNQAIIEYKMAHIDHEKELYYPQFDNNEHIYVGKMVLDGRKNEPESNQNFELMTGHKANGPVVSKLIKRKLTIIDSFSSYDFEIIFDEHTTFNYANSLFISNREWINNGIDHTIGGGLSLSHADLTAVGEVQTANGAHLPVVLEINMGFSSVQLYAIKNGRKIALMITNYLSMGS